MEQVQTQQQQHTSTSPLHSPTSMSREEGVGPSCTSARLSPLPQGMMAQPMYMPKGELMPLDHSNLVLQERANIIGERNPQQYQRLAYTPQPIHQSQMLQQGLPVHPQFIHAQHLYQQPQQIIQVPGGYLIQNPGMYEMKGARPMQTYMMAQLPQLRQELPGMAPQGALRSGSAGLPHQQMAYVPVSHQQMPPMHTAALTQQQLRQQLHQAALLQLQQEQLQRMVPSPYTYQAMQSQSPLPLSVDPRLMPSVSQRAVVDGVLPSQMVMVPDVGLGAGVSAMPLPSMAAPTPTRQSSKDESVVDITDKKVLKRIANRKSAQLSRQRKKAYIDELKSENEELKRQEEILAVVPDAVFAFNAADGKIWFASKSAARQFGLDMQYLLSATFFDLVTTDCSKRLKNMISRGLEKHPNARSILLQELMTVRFRNKGGEMLGELSGRINRQPDGTVHCVCSVRLLNLMYDDHNNAHKKAHIATGYNGDQSTSDMDPDGSQGSSGEDCTSNSSSGMGSGMTPPHSLQPSLVGPESLSDSVSQGSGGNDGDDDDVDAGTDTDLSSNNGSARDGNRGEGLKHFAATSTCPIAKMVTGSGGGNSSSSSSNGTTSNGRSSSSAPSKTDGRPVPSNRENGPIAKRPRLHSGVTAPTCGGAAARHFEGPRTAQI